VRFLQKLFGICVFSEILIRKNARLVEKHAHFVKIVIGYQLSEIRLSAIGFADNFIQVSKSAMDFYGIFSPPNHRGVKNSELKNTNSETMANYQNLQLNAARIEAKNDS